MSFPNMSRSEMDIVIRDMWENLGRTFCEFAHLDKFDPYSPSGHINLVGKEILEHVKAEGKGAIFISGHFANWELLPLGAKGLGLTGVAVYRAANNPIVDKWIIERRKKHIYPEQAPKGRSGIKQLMRALKNKQHIVMLVDQKMNEGVSLPLFNREAMTSDGAARLALNFDCPIVPAAIRRLDGPSFEITVYPPMTFEPTGDRDTDIVAFTRSMNEWLEDRIREAPSQWLWVHNRWPKAAKPSLLDPAPAPEVEA